jgi:hypothetical protein
LSHFGMAAPDFDGTVGGDFEPGIWSEGSGRRRSGREW